MIPSIFWIRTSKYSPFCPAGMSVNPVMMGRAFQIHTSPHLLKRIPPRSLSLPHIEIQCTSPSAPLCFGSPSLISKPCPNVSAAVPINRFHFNTGCFVGSTRSHVLHPSLLIVWYHQRGALVQSALRFHKSQVPPARLHRCHVRGRLPVMGTNRVVARMEKRSDGCGGCV